MVVSVQEAELDFIVRGDVQGVGYGQYVAGVGRKLKVVGFVQNLKDGTVQIQCNGDKNAIIEFKKKINQKNPPEAPLINVEDIEETKLAQGTIKQTIFEERYDDSIADMSQGFTGMNYINLFRKETGESFERMDEKYHIISQSKLAVIDKIEERNKTFESRIEITEKSVEKTEKNIESLLKILVEKS